MKSAESCPCGGGAPYARCCGLWHEGETALCAPDAVHLMRSRYSAYVLGRHAYLLQTWHPSTRPGRLEADPLGFRWLGLEVRRQRDLDADHAEVEFVVRGKLGGRAQRLHEVSRFVLEGGRWYYVDGVLLTAR
jgi:SEC-C motif domain protein